MHAGAEPGHDGVLEVERVVVGGSVAEVGDGVAIGGDERRVEDEDVVVGAAGQRVQPDAADQPVVAVQAAQRVVAGIADERVGGAVAGDGVGRCIAGA